MIKNEFDLLVCLAERMRLLCTECRLHAAFTERLVGRFWAPKLRKSGPCCSCLGTIALTLQRVHCKPPNEEFHIWILECSNLQYMPWTGLD